MRKFILAICLLLLGSVLRAEAGTNTNTLVSVVNAFRAKTAQADIPEWATKSGTGKAVVVYFLNHGAVIVQGMNCESDNVTTNGQLMRFAVRIETEPDNAAHVSYKDYCKRFATMEELVVEMWALNTQLLNAGANMIDAALRPE